MIDASDMLGSYTKKLNHALGQVNGIEFEKVCERLHEIYLFSYPVIVMGNGGSAAVADHFVCDHVKGISEDTGCVPNVHSLTANITLITALSNDLSYDKVFARQIRYISRAQGGMKGLVIGMSVSGTSKNILKGFKEARLYGHQTLMMTGNTKVKKEDYDYLFTLPDENYGVVEDCFSVLMHVMAQYIRTIAAIDPAGVKTIID